MKLLKQYSNGMWVEVEADEEDFYIEEVLKREPWFAPRVGREPMTTKEQVMEYLKTGKKLDYDDEWNAVIKMEMPKKLLHPVEMFKCKCGHTIPKNQVMSTSRGTSCANCYDRMDL